MNILQDLVSNLTFDPCFKVQWGHHTKKAMYLLSIGPWARNLFPFLLNSLWEVTITAGVLLYVYLC